MPWRLVFALFGALPHVEAAAELRGAMATAAGTAFAQAGDKPAVKAERRRMATRAWPQVWLPKPAGGADAAE